MTPILKCSTSLRVRYGETDQMGYCYYGNYAQFCEVGRVEALRSLGMSYKKMEEKGVMLPVSEYSIKFKRPAKYDDLIEIETTVLELDGIKLHFDYRLYNESKELIAEAKTTLVFVSKSSMRPTQPPKDFLELIGKTVK